MVLKLFKQISYSKDSIQLLKPKNLSRKWYLLLNCHDNHRNAEKNSNGPTHRHSIARTFGAAELDKRVNQTYA